MKKQRKHYTPEEKVAILRRHLLDKEPISKLCDERGGAKTAAASSAQGRMKDEDPNFQSRG
jgi:transposase-like protein